MGKIHKALEKSKKEHQLKSKSNSFATFGAGRSPQKNNGQGDEERNLKPAKVTPAAQGLDLGTIHELLHESTEAGVSENRDDNDTTSKANHDAPAIKKAPLVALPALENPRLPVRRNGETVAADLEFGKKDSRKKAIEAKAAQDIQDVVPADTALTKTELPNSAEKTSKSTKPVTGHKYVSVNNEKISVLTPNESSDNKIFVFKEKMLNDVVREDVAVKPESAYVDKNDLGGPDSDSISYSTVDNSLVTLLKPRSYEAEQFKILRTNLLFPESGNPAKSILITSAAPSDGKSFISANLAVSLALDQDRKVLLIDADVRRSEIHKIFGLNRVDKGICDFLTNQIPLTSLLVKTSLNNLVILPAGKLMRSPDELQSLEKLPKLFEELAVHFSDYVIVIDSPPPKLASETGVLARLVDSIVIVMKAGVTRREYVEETIDLLEKGKIAGIVFNWHENRMSNYKKYAKDREYYS